MVYFVYLRFFSEEFVDDAKSIAKQLQVDKKFNIIGVPLNGINLTPLTNYDDIPLDVTSVDSQVETATNIDSVLSQFQISMDIVLK